MLVQMAGAPGSGKSTVARGLAAALGFAVLDHDVSKTALLDADRPFDAAGRESYAVLLAFADDLLGQRLGVIIDSPCYYDTLLSAGQSMAARHGVPYRYVECVADMSTLDDRLRSRSRRPSQVQAVDPTVFDDWIHGQKRPGAYLRLDTNRPAAECIATALAYVQEDAQASASATRTG